MPLTRPRAERLAGRARAISRRAASDMTIKAGRWRSSASARRTARKRSKSPVSTSSQAAFCEAAVFGLVGLAEVAGEGGMAAEARACQPLDVVEQLLLGGLGLAWDVGVFGAFRHDVVPAAVVGARVEHHAFGFEPVAPGASRLLL